MFKLSSFSSMNSQFIHKYFFTVKLSIFFDTFLKKFYK